MKTLNKTGIAFAGVLFAMAYLAVADEMDMAGSKDHPLFTRMANYYIDVRPESEPVLKEVAKLLSESPSLKLHVVGHTDNVGRSNIT